MDSFGRSPFDDSFPHEYSDIIQQFKKYEFFKYQIQPIESKTCGYFCLHFLALLSLGLDLQSFKEDYTDNLYNNDQVVLNILNSMI